MKYQSLWGPIKGPTSTQSLEDMGRPSPCPPNRFRKERRAAIGEVLAVRTLCQYLGVGASEETWATNLHPEDKGLHDNGWVGGVVGAVTMQPGGWLLRVGWYTVESSTGVRGIREWEELFYCPE